MSELKVNKVTPRSGTTVTLGDSGDTITIPSGATIDLSSATQTGVGGTNTPAFQLQLSSAQSISNATFTKINFDVENWDTDNACSSGTFTVPTGKAGKYWFQNTTEMGNIDTGEFVNIMIYVNGASAAVARWYSSGTNAGVRARVQAVLNLSEGDTVEGYVYHNEGASESTSGGAAETRFTGFRLIGI